VATAEVTAAEMKAVDAATSVTVNAEAVTKITGAAVDVLAVYGGGFSGLNNEALAITDVIDVNLANVVSGKTSGIVTATIQKADIADLVKLSGVGNAYTVELSTNQVNAADLNLVDGKTTVSVNANSILELVGTAAEIDKAVNAAGITRTANLHVRVTEGSASLAQLQSIDAVNGTGNLVYPNVTDTAANLPRMQP